MDILIALFGLFTSTRLHSSLFQLIQESNDSITQMKSIESLVSLSAKVDFECRVSEGRRPLG